MKKSLFAILCMLSLATITTNANAQFSIGVKGGLSIPNLSSGGSNSNPLNSGYSSRLGPDAAVYFEYHFSNFFSLQPEIEYSSQGGKKNGLQAYPTPEQVTPLFPPGQAPAYLYANFKNETKLNYIMIPVLAKIGFDLGENFRLYIDLGPYIGFLASAKQVTSGTSLVYADAGGQMPLSPQTQSFDATTDVKSSINSTNFGLEGGVGLAYVFGRNSVFIEGGGNYGFKNIQKYSADGDNKTGAATIMVGYAMRFVKTSHKAEK